jgi:hypothetical protein
MGSPKLLLSSSMVDHSGIFEPLCALSFWTEGVFQQPDSNPLGWKDGQTQLVMHWCAVRHIISRKFKDHALIMPPLHHGMLIFRSDLRLILIDNHWASVTLLPGLPCDGMHKHLFAHCHTFNLMAEIWPTRRCLQQRRQLRVPFGRLFICVAVLFEPHPSPGHWRS